MCAPEENEFAVAFSQREETMNQAQRTFAAAAALKTGGRPFEGSAVTEQTVIRKLTSEEITTLQRTCRCQSRDWSKVHLLLPNKIQRIDQSEALENLVSDNRFDGTIILDMTDNLPYNDEERKQSMSEWYRLPPGIHSNLMVCDSLVKLKSCRVYRNSLISNTYVEFNAIVVQCGRISTSPEGISYGRLSISVGPESGGGRKLVLTSEHTMIDVCRQLRSGPSALPALPNQRVPLNIIGEGCIVHDTPTIKNVFLHDHSSIEAATSVAHATLFSHSSIRGSCAVSNVLLQWDSSIVDHSSVTDTLLMEEAHCGPSSIVASTVLGPDVHVSAGEVHASIVGPNTNAHHQSLVIGVLWPLGRGNVGYGANVGSNHTGRLPDQETAAGEGVFWGLSNVIKFPVDLSFAPYSIVAAGTTLPSQRVCMPFSLIMENGKANEIIPGWVLQSSPYTLARSEKKYTTRRKAKRHHHYTGWKIFRPEIMAMCHWAKNALELGATKDRTDGVGSCELSSRARDGGIRAYTECLQRYALHGLLRWILHVTDTGKIAFDMHALEHELADGHRSNTIVDINPMAKVEWPTFPWDMKGTSEWDYQKQLLLELFPLDQNSSLWLEDVLLKLVALEKDFSRRIHKSKQRDDSRGAKIIPGYALAHVSADKDTVILEAQTTAEQVDSAVADILTSTGTRSRL
jgi:hypothetical protein